MSKMRNQAKKITRYKFAGKGWHSESYRHSLAARGVRTSFARSNWDQKLFPTELISEDEKILDDLVDAGRWGKTEEDFKVVMGKPELSESDRRIIERYFAERTADEMSESFGDMPIAAQLDEIKNVARARAEVAVREHDEAFARGELPNVARTRSYITPERRKRGARVLERERIQRLRKAYRQPMSRERQEWTERLFRSMGEVDPMTGEQRAMMAGEIPFPESQSSPRPSQLIKLQMIAEGIHKGKRETKRDRERRLIE